MPVKPAARAFKGEYPLIADIEAVLGFFHEFRGDPPGLLQVVHDQHIGKGRGRRLFKSATRKPQHALQPFDQGCSDSRAALE